MADYGPQDFVGRIIDHRNPPPAEVEALARELCRCDGHDPDALAIDPSHVMSERAVKVHGRVILLKDRVIPAWCLFRTQAMRMLNAGWERRQ